MFRLVLITVPVLVGIWLLLGVAFGGPAKADEPNWIMLGAAAEAFAAGQRGSDPDYELQRLRLEMQRQHEQQERQFEQQMQEMQRQQQWQIEMNRPSIWDR